MYLEILSLFLGSTEPQMTPKMFSPVPHVGHSYTVYVATPSGSALASLARVYLPASIGIRLSDFIVCRPLL